MQVQWRPDPRPEGSDASTDVELQDPTKSRKISFSTLPQEIQLEIVSHLPYPDALSLKLTSQHFWAVAAGSLTVLSRVSWLLDRTRLDLPIPKSGNLRLQSDSLFLRNAEVQRILKARRRHEECADAWRGSPHSGKWPGCLVVPGVEVCDAGVVMLRKKGVEPPRWNVDKTQYVLASRHSKMTLWGSLTFLRPDGAVEQVREMFNSERRRRLQSLYTGFDTSVLQAVFVLLVIGLAVILVRDEAIRWAKDLRHKPIFE